MTQQTVLNETHKRLGAKMVDFGGWDMPLHYGSQIEEHLAVRNSCGMFDVSHMCVIDIVGPEAKDFLQKIAANNVDKFKAPGKALYSVMLNEAGGVVDDLIIYYVGEGQYRLVVNAGCTQKDLAWMLKQQGNLDLTITPRRDLAIIAVQGPLACEKLGLALPLFGIDREVLGPLKPFSFIQIGEYFIARTGYTGEDGFEISLPTTEAQKLWQALQDAGVHPAGLGARDTLRLEAGMNLYGQDMDEETSPLDAGLAWTLETDSPRNFIGKVPLLARGQTWQFSGLVLLDKGVLRGHQKILTPHGDGEITSGSFSPTLQCSIALARLPLQIKLGDTVEVDIRGKLLKAKVVKPPFVRHGKSLI